MGDDTSSQVSSIYKKLSHTEHVLQLPDTYVGSIERHTESIYVLCDDKIQKKQISYVPALYKIIDEILVNSIDQHVRMREAKSSDPVTQIKVNINNETGEIQIYNNGEGIDVVFMDEHQCYVPELIFGNLLTSTNYDTNSEKIVGGKNGYGAKLANIFSTQFYIETIDSKLKKKYTQEFRSNMTEKKKPKITKSSNKPHTLFRFIPDYKRFGMEGLDDDIISLIGKRVYDICACTDKSVSVFLNDKKLDVKTFEKYVDLYIGQKADKARVFITPNERWEVVATSSNDDIFEQVSFVNGINTIRGGKHVDYISDQIRDKVVEMFKKKKKMEIKGNIVKNQLMLFVKSTIVNPSFDSQTKETLTTAKKGFGSDCKLENSFMDKLWKTDFIEKILNQSEFKNSKQLKKTDGKKQRNILGVPKLCDANRAGTKDSKKCTLILTEGDSAKSMAIAGLSVVGRDHYGVFPLKGKVLNVKDADVEKITKNDEINHLKTIIGLKNGEKYDENSLNNLRYGKIMVMTDQDVDGSHIKGLLLNIFHSHWKTLLEIDYVTCLLTPIIKATKKKSNLSFYTLTDYEKWKETAKSGGYSIKYYKGLGTSTTVEAKEYFKDMKKVTYVWDEQSDESMNKAFHPKRADDRKKWLDTYDRNNILEHSKNQVKISEFVDRELIHFSNYDNQRSIPSCIDGLKPSQRKILYGCFKRKLKNEIKVAQLAGYISEHACYHHGEMSLNMTIVAMAQNFVGSNNINLLYPNGQFGTRIGGGKDAASSRYIFTYLSEVTRYIFREEDDQILKYLEDDGYPIEPEYYVPIIPMILINGTRGIGTGYSTFVPPHNPMEVIQLLKQRINEKPLNDIHPYFRGFKGQVECIDESKWITRGEYSTDDDTLHVTELPIGRWTDDFKAHVEGIIMSKKKIIKSYNDNSTESDVNFTIQFEEGQLDDYMDKKKKHNNGVDELLKLSSSSDTSYTNMNLHNEDSQILKYDTIYEIMENFYTIRRDMYNKRKEYQLDKLKKELELISYRMKFILEIINETIEIRNKPKAQLEEELAEKEYPHINGDNWDYLIEMPIRNLTKEKVEELMKKKEDKETEYNELYNTEIRDIWLNELKELEKKLK